MDTRSRRRTRPADEEALDMEFERAYGLDEVTDDDIEDFLSRSTEEERKPGLLNLPTLAGLATIGVGSAYLLEQLGLFSSAFSFSGLLGPWIIGVLIILVGFAVLQWSPRKKRASAKARREAERRRRASAARPAERPDPPGTAARERVAPTMETRRKAFVKSRTNRKIAGVCGGIGEYFGIDPLLVRIAFVVTLIAGSGIAIPVYLLLAWLMPKDDCRPAARFYETPRGERSGPPRSRDDDERVIIIRDR